MESMDYLKSQIRETILSSDEYVEYKRLESVLMRNPDLMRQVDEFRRRNFELQNSEELDNALDAVEALDKEFENVREVDIVNRFLASEACLCRMVQDLCYTIVDAVDFNVDFLH